MVRTETTVASFYELISLPSLSYISFSVFPGESVCGFPFRVYFWKGNFIYSNRCVETESGTVHSSLSEKEEEEGNTMQIIVSCESCFKELFCSCWGFGLTFFSVMACADKYDLFFWLSLPYSMSEDSEVQKLSQVSSSLARIRNDDKKLINFYQRRPHAASNFHLRRNLSP